MSVDTDLLARFLLKDDPAQFRRAVATLLELAWVLKARETTREGAPPAHGSCRT